MARGRECKKCNRFMTAIKEEYAPDGVSVVYECLNRDCRRQVKVFEKKR